MSIRKLPQTTERTLECDDCGDMLDKDFPDSDFAGMIEYAKALGWRIMKEPDGGWAHYCPDCA